MLLRRSAAVLAALAVGSLAGCATTTTVNTSTSTAASAPTSSTTTATPSTSVSVGSAADSTKTFAVVLPPEWKPTKAPNSAVVLAITAPKTTGTVYTNFNVVRTNNVQGQSSKDLADASATQMRQQGGTVTPVAERTIGGQDASGYRVDRTVQETKVSQTQFFVQHGDFVFVTTMTSATSARSDADATMNAILATWAWTK